MKKLIVVSVVVAALAATIVGTAFAAGPTPPGTCGTCDGSGIGQGRERVTWAGMPDAVAQLLGMDTEAIHAERLSGKSLAAIAAEKGISKETLVATIVDAKREAVSEAVQAGTITQEQADHVLQQMEERVPLMVDRTTVGPANGRMGGHWSAAGMGRWTTAQ
jgi:lambda repressor-like predicted transcriptional regulator